MDYNNCPGFEHGYPFQTPRDYYGIWSPAFDCFIFVHHDIDRLIKLQWLLSSKILGIIFKLDHNCAVQNQIDNLYCEHWTITKDHKIDIALAYKKGGSAESCQIIEKDQNQFEEEFKKDLQYIRTWTLFLNHWCQKISYINPLKILVEGVNQTDEITSVYHTLWLGNDPTKVEKLLNEKNISY